MSRDALARRQAELVAALVGGAALPPGFDNSAVKVAADALLRKRAGEVAEVWPSLRAAHGPEWIHIFATWAAGRPPHGAMRDGWDLARSLAAQGRLRTDAAVELAAREVAWRYDGEDRPARRRLPAVRWVARRPVVQVLGRIWAPR